MATKEIYRIRKSWDNPKSQLGAYTILDNAKKVCDKAGIEYFIFNSVGEIVYPVAEIGPKYEVVTEAGDPKVIWDFLKDAGFNDYGVAGLMGNLQAESGLIPCNLENSYSKSFNMTDLEYTIAVDNGSYDKFVTDHAGYGLAQWTYWSRKEAMLKYHQSKDKSISDLTTQLEFLIKELKSDFKSVYNTLHTAKSVLEASNAVLLKFEQPADQSVRVQEQRAAMGQKYYDKYAIPVVPSNPNPPVVNSNMKYSQNNPPMVCMMTQSTCYKETSPMTIRGVLWHSTGADNPWLCRYVQPDDDAPNRDELIAIIGKNKYNNDMNHIYREAGLNAWIGKLDDGTVTSIQTMPWDYMPWGCGSSSKGSCNNGWIQFEICEDDLSDPEYFATAYKEACELTAYLCTLFNINPYDNVMYNGVSVPTILCHADSHALKLGSNHGDINHWFPKYGKSMDTVRKDVAELMGNIITPIDPPSATTQFQVGDEVKLKPGATYASGATIPNWVFNSKLYVREIRSDGSIIISTVPTGPITGVVKPEALIQYEEETVVSKPISKPFEPYFVQVTATSLNVRAAADPNSKINTQIRKNGIYTIVQEKNGWGKLKSGAGWINLDYTVKYTK